MIKCLEDMLAKFETHLLSYGDALIDMLSIMFFKYHDLVAKSESGMISQINSKEQNND